MRGKKRLRRYWVFVAPTVPRARVHRSECKHCNNGVGQPGQKKDVPRAATEWHPFHSKSAAVAYMRKRGVRNSGLCGHCHP